MSLFRKIVLSILCFIASFNLITLSAQATQNNSKNSKTVISENIGSLTPEQIKQLEHQISQDDVDKTLAEIKGKFIKPKAVSDISSTEIRSYASILLDYSKNPNIEKETRIFKGWYKKIGTGLQIMADLSLKAETAEMNKNAENIQLLNKEMETIRAKLDEILKKPEKIPQKKSTKQR